MTVPMSEEVARTEVNAWIRKVAATLPDELVQVWLTGFPPGCTARQEMEARLPILEAFAERLALIDLATPRCVPYVPARRPSWWQRARAAIVRGMVAQSESQMWRRGR